MRAAKRATQPTRLCTSLILSPQTCSISYYWIISSKRKCQKKNQVTSVISAEPNNEQRVIVSEDKFSILDGGAFNEENLFGLTKHYRQEQQSICPDTRFYIEFSRELLIHLLAVFSQNNRNLAERDTPPFFGFSETLLREVLIVALINKHQSANECLDVRQLQFSLSGKIIIRNLLHTAYKSNQNERAFFEYKTDTGIKACYIRVFREACEELVARNKKGREEDLNITSSLSYGDRESCLDSNKNSNSGTSALTKI